jgi:anti-repressor protein
LQGGLDKLFLSEELAMNELIKIENRDGIETVNARELHEKLGVQSKFADWVKNRIEKYGFIEGQDFCTLSKSLENGGSTKDYYISIDMAKELSMVENNEKGREMRRYFIEIEKKAKRPLTDIEMLERQVQIMKRQEKEIEEIKASVKQIEAQIETSQKDFYTVAGYCSLRGLKIEIGKANMLGRKSTKLSNEYGYEIGSASDPRFGKVNTYHLDILSQVIDQECSK